MMFAKRYEDAPAVWGVGRVVVDGEVTPWPVAQPDIDDEAESLAPRLAELGLDPGGLVLIVSMLSHAMHVVPLERAAGKVGALYSSADSTRSDAFRVAVLTRQLAPQVVFGITGDVLDGLADVQRDPAELLGHVPAVMTADVDAHTRLRAAGLAPRRWVRLGPTSAVESGDADIAIYDSDRWLVEEGGDELVITNLVPRLTECARIRTGVRGFVAEPGRIFVD